MTRQNRVTPYGDVIATPARGMFTGNRGCLHDDNSAIVRSHVGRRWIICILEFKGRRRRLMLPGRYTELFFLDEATALAAGHRPCAECQRGRFELFRDAWARGNPEVTESGRPSASSIDAVLHRDRLGPGGRKAIFEAQLADLPHGAFVALEPEGEPYLFLGDCLLRWTPFGYTERSSRPAVTRVQVLTPRSIVRALAAGFAAGIHPTSHAL